MIDFFLQQKDPIWIFILVCVICAIPSLVYYFTRVMASAVFYSWWKVKDDYKKEQK
jgi:hypothetical protein